jgi:hypothetical protein
MKDVGVDRKDNNEPEASARAGERRALAQKKICWTSLHHLTKAAETKLVRKIVLAARTRAGFLYFPGVSVAHCEADVG